MAASQPPHNRHNRHNCHATDSQLSDNCHNCRGIASKLPHNNRPTTGAPQELPSAQLLRAISHNNSRNGLMGAPQVVRESSFPISLNMCNDGQSVLQDALQVSQQSFSPHLPVTIKLGVLTLTGIQLAGCHRAKRGGQRPASWTTLCYIPPSTIFPGATTLPCHT